MTSTDYVDAALSTFIHPEASQIKADILEDIEYLKHPNHIYVEVKIDPHFIRTNVLTNDGILITSKDYFIPTLSQLTFDRLIKANVPLNKTLAIASDIFSIDAAHRVQLLKNRASKVDIAVFSDTNAPLFRAIY